MKKNLTVLVLSLAALLSNCKQKQNEFNIAPLSPYSDVIKLTKDDVGSTVQTVIKTHYYLVNESVDYTEKSKNRLQNYIETKLKADIAANKSIYFTFYKGSFALSKNSTPTKSELSTTYANNKLAEFEYIDGKLYNFDFYKDGKYYTSPPEERQWQRGR